jgi:hypothetical protein
VALRRDKRGSVEVLSRDREGRTGERGTGGFGVAPEPGSLRGSETRGMTAGFNEAGTLCAPCDLCGEQLSFGAIAPEATQQQHK